MPAPVPLKVMAVHAGRGRKMAAVLEPFVPIISPVAMNRVGLKIGVKRSHRHGVTAVLNRITPIAVGVIVDRVAAIDDNGRQDSGDMV